jgi:HD-like signal output (HDOD) protein
VRSGGSAAKTVDMPRSLIKQYRVIILRSQISWTFSSDWRVPIRFCKSLAAVHDERRSIERARTEVMLRVSSIPEISINFS